VIFTQAALLVAVQPQDPLVETVTEPFPPLALKDRLGGDTEKLQVTTTKSDTLMAVPPGVVTLILPVVAPAGTTATIWDGEETTKLVAFVLLNLTAAAPVKLVPVIVTLVPMPPLDGSIPVMVGGSAGVVAEASFE
jgi:hypothetical protein